MDYAGTFIFGWFFFNESLRNKGVDHLLSGNLFSSWHICITRVYRICFFSIFRGLNLCFGTWMKQLFPHYTHMCAKEPCSLFPRHQYQDIGGQWLHCTLQSCCLPNYIEGFLALPDCYSSVLPQQHWWHFGPDYSLGGKGGVYVLCL